MYLYYLLDQWYVSACMKIYNMVRVEIFYEK